MPTPGTGTEDDPYVIADLAGLQAMQNDLQAHYALCADIDASATRTWTDAIGPGSGFIPIGTDETNPFTGSFDGRGFIIDGLYINRGAEDNVGLFGYAQGDLAHTNTQIVNVGLTNMDITGHINVGALVGRMTAGGSNSNNAPKVMNAYSTGNVVGLTDATDYGGLVGFNWGFSTVSSSWSMSNVTSVGTRVGGLAGYNSNASTIENSYAMGDVHGKSGVGGLVGAYPGGYIVEHSYSTGKVTAIGSFVGGLIGERSGNATVKGLYWDMESSAISSSPVGSPRFTHEMKSGNNFGWDTNIWHFSLGEYPDLIDNPRQP